MVIINFPSLNSVLFLFDPAFLFINGEYIFSTRNVDVEFFSYVFELFANNSDFKDNLLSDVVVYLFVVLFAKPSRSYIINSKFKKLGMFNETSTFTLAYFKLIAIDSNILRKISSRKFTF